MALDTTVEMLEQIPIFSGLSHLQLTAILSIGKKAFFTEGQSILEAGKSGGSAFIILSGKAESKTGEPGMELTETLLPGSLLGELAMLVEMEHTVTVAAAERVRALEISREALFTVLEADPSMAQHFSDKLMQRLLDLASELMAVDAQVAAIEASLQVAAG
jgi:CRP/FNR family cyclic AMP-dependent transcriptional regulator